MVKKDYSGIFKAYDIRGVFPSELDKAFAFLLGKAFVVYTNAKEIGVAYDGRKSSPVLFAELVKGITSQGADVVDLGLSSTCMTYYSVIQGKLDAGIMITASHNPKDWNGFKLMNKGAEPIFSENGSLDILELIKKNDFPDVKKKGKVKKKSFAKDYGLFLKDFFAIKLKDSLSLVIDQGNGSGSVEVQVLKDLFPSAKILNDKVSGAFPSHEPNPMVPENRKQLVTEVKKRKADLGVIFDGDADRVCFVNSKGDFVRPDIILGLLLDKVKSGSFVYDTRSSRAVQEKGDKKGLQGIMSKSGRTFIYKVMKEEKAVVGAENSGHFFFKESSYLDNAGICALKLLSLVASQDKSFDVLVEENNPYFHSGEKNFKVKNPSKAFLIVEHAFRDAKKTLFIDGISVYYDDFWFNMRKSNTENMIRINAEAVDKKTLDKVLQTINNSMALAK